MADSRHARIKQIFSDACELAPERRADFLRTECGDDLPLFDAVSALLAHQQGADSAFLASSPFQNPRTSMDQHTDATDAIREGPGSVIGRYRLVKKIGTGGFGEVYQADQLEPVTRPVALKIIKLGMDTRQVIARFEAERQALALMDHPNIAKVLDADTTDSGRPYFVMELVNGAPITEFCDLEELSVRDRLALFVTACNAVQHAHSKGLIHRDIKPSNILVGRQDGVPAPRIIDFGIAKATDSELTGRMLLTNNLQVIGTPTYMSPEQAAMRGSAIDARSDVYSLGVVLYELLTGTTPFTSHELQAAGLAGMQRLICEVDPPKPSTRISALAQSPATSASPIEDDDAAFSGESKGRSSDIGRKQRAEYASQSRKLRGDLDWIVMRAMEKDPARRYASARELAEDVQRYLTDRPVHAGPPSRGYRVAKFIRRRRFVLTIGAVAALLAAGITTVLIYGLFVTDPQPVTIKTLAVLPLENVLADEGNAYFADGMTETLIGQLDRMESIRVISASSIMRFKSTAKSLSDIGNELSADAIMRGTVRQFGDRVELAARLYHARTGSLLWSGSYERKPQDVLDLQNELARAITREIATTLTPREQALLAERAPSVVPEAHDTYLKGRYHWNKRTKRGIERAIEYFNDSIRIAPDYARAHAGLADAYMLLTPYGNLPPSATYPKARAAAERALELDGTLGQAHASLGVILHEYEWKHDLAEAEFLRAIELNPNYAPARQWYAELLTRLGRHDEAIVQIERARKVDPLSLIVNSIVGWVFSHAGRADSAIEQLRETIEMEPDFVPARGYLGMALERRGDYTLAIEQFQRAFDLSRGNPRYLSEISVAKAMSGDAASARQALRELIPLAETEQIHAFLVARVCASLGDDDDALKWLERGAEQRGVWMLFLEIDPLFDRLRADPGFQSFIRRVGLQ